MQPYLYNNNASLLQTVPLVPSMLTYPYFYNADTCLCPFGVPINGAPIKDLTVNYQQHALIWRSSFLVLYSNQVKPKIVSHLPWQLAKH